MSLIFRSMPPSELRARTGDGLVCYTRLDRGAEHSHPWRRKSPADHEISAAMRPPLRRQRGAARAAAVLLQDLGARADLAQQHVIAPQIRQMLQHAPGVGIGEQASV